MSQADLAAYGVLTKDNCRFFVSNAQPLFSKAGIIRDISNKYKNDKNILNKLNKNFNEQDFNEQDFVLDGQVLLAQQLGAIQQKLAYSDKLARDLLYNSISNNGNVYQRSCFFFRDNAKYRFITNSYNNAVRMINDIKNSQDIAKIENLSKSLDNKYTINKKQNNIGDQPLLVLNNNNNLNQDKDNDEKNNEVYLQILKDSTKRKVINNFKKEITQIVKTCLCCCGKGSVMTKE